MTSSTRQIVQIPDSQSVWESLVVEIVAELERRGRPKKALSEEDLQEIIEEPLKKLSQKSPELAALNRTVDKEAILRHLEKRGEEARQRIKKEFKASSGPDSLADTVRQISAVALSSLPLAFLDDHEARIAEARIIKAKKLIGLEPDENISLDRVNRFLKDHAGQTMDAETSVLIAQLIANLRSQRGCRLVFKTDDGPVECTLTSAFRSDRGTRRFQIFTTGTPQQSLWQRAVLPEGLSLQR